MSRMENCITNRNLQLHKNTQMKGKQHMEKKTLDMHYTTIQKLEENEVITRFLFSLKEKFTAVAGTGHKINFSINVTEKQIIALYDGDIKINARIINNNVRSESFTKMPELMKIFESAKKEFEEEYSAYPEALSVLEPVMHIHSCTVMIRHDSDIERKYDYNAKKLIDRITQNKTIIMLR